MKQLATLVVSAAMVLALGQTAQAQWGWPSQPVVVAPPPVVRVYQPVMPVVPVYQPVVRVYRPPMVVYQPTTIVTTRNRPILGGTVTRTRRAYQRTYVW